MRPIDRRLDEDLLESPLLGLRRDDYFLLTRLRNAWHGTTSNQYRGTHDLFDRLEGAKAAAEGWRAPGSHFVIRQVPGLTVLSSMGSIAMIDFHSARSFGRWDRQRGSTVLQIGTSVRDLLHAFGPGGEWRGAPPNSDSLIHARGERLLDAPMLLGRSYRAWDSVSFGRGFYLGWADRPADYSAAATDAAVDAFCQVNEIVLRERALQAVFEAADIREVWPSCSRGDLLRWLADLGLGLGSDVAA